MHFQYIYCVSTSTPTCCWIDTEQAGNSYNNQQGQASHQWLYFMTFKFYETTLTTLFLYKPHIVLTPDHILLYNSLKMARTGRNM